MSRSGRRRTAVIRFFVRLGRAAAVTLLLFAVLVVLLTGSAVLWLRSSLPLTNGVVTVAGLAAPVDIVRDANAVPHIFASSENDAYFALGYVHAQDRLWQMEMQRRLGAGRLSEIAGPSGLSWDRLARTLGLYRRAQRSVALLSRDVRRALEAYARGVNAYLRTHEGAWPPEYYLTGIRPEPWRVADSLVWGRLMALRLATNWRSELLRARVLRRLGADRLRDLWPAYPADGPTSLVEAARNRTGLYRDLPLDHLWAALPAEAGAGGASNEWVLDGRRTASGKPILANDPHLGLTAPILWFLARIETPTLSLAGATVPGVPFHILGHNGRIAWGFTTTYADTDDLFVEKTDPADPERYLTPTGSRPFVRRHETIRVRGAEPVTLTVRETRHGPVIDGIVEGAAGASEAAGGVLALAAPWLGEDDRTAEALYRLNRAGDWTSFTAALAAYGAPVQNVAYADVAGNVGLYTPGRIPIRRGGDGFLPAPGWTGTHDWAGFIPFADLPHRLNPAAGVIVNANNRLVDASYPYFLSVDWSPAYRARRIADSLAETGRHTVETTARLQGDSVSYAARDLLPLLLDAPVTDERARRAKALLRRWDGRMDRRRPEPLIFQAWLRELNRLLYADELGDLFGAYWGLRPRVVKLMLTRRRQWCDDVSTQIRETCPERIAAALGRALDLLAARYGDDMAAWRWGEAHYADLRHRVFDAVPVVRAWANIRIAADGGDFTVNRAAAGVGRREAPFADRHGAGFRAIYDLARPDRSLFIQATGQSGNPFSPHYDDMTQRWRDVRYIRLAGSRAALEKAGADVLRLAPAATRSPGGPDP